MLVLTVSRLSKMSGSSVAMRYMTPERYAKTQASGQFVNNTKTVNEFAEYHGPLDENDKVLDIGSDQATFSGVTCVLKWLNIAEKIIMWKM